MTSPSADPWRDTDVIDARAPRANQVFVGLMSLTAILTGWWALLGIVAAQLAIGLTIGRRWCLPCWFYFTVVQPRAGEGSIEDSRPPRFANMVGFAFLTAATGAFALGFESLGTVLGGIVAALALLAATTGFCVGCEAYRLAARLRGIKPGEVLHIDLDELPGQAKPDTGVVLFSHPLCSECQELEHRFEQDGTPMHVVDVSRAPELARKYRVSLVPSAFRVSADGRVVARLA